MAAGQGRVPHLRYFLVGTKLLNQGFDRIRSQAWSKEICDFVLIGDTLSERSLITKKIYGSTAAHTCFFWKCRSFEEHRKLSFLAYWKI